MDDPREEQGTGPADPGRGESREPPTEQEILDELAQEMLRIHTESYGRGAGEANAFVGAGWVVVVLGDMELLPSEQVLVETGKQEAVIEVRTQYQIAIQSSFRAAVERATGRTVVGFASTTNVDEPRFVAEIFKLA